VKWFLERNLMSEISPISVSLPLKLPMHRFIDNVLIRNEDPFNSVRAFLFYSIIINGHSLGVDIFFVRANQVGHFNVEIKHFRSIFKP
jgi:hypothetical protein